MLTISFAQITVCSCSAVTVAFYHYW